MAVSHVSVRLLTILAFTTFPLRSRSTDQNQGPVEANTQIVLPPVCFVRRQSWANRVKFPIVEWSKHGRMVIALPEIKQPTEVDIILLCGDIHPQPGPLISNSNKREERTVRHFKSTRLKTYATVAHLNVRSMVSRENFHLITQTISSNDYDIFTISETWLDLSTSDNDIQIPGYILFRQDRGMHKTGGGIVVYVKDIYKASVVTEFSAVSDCNFQQLWLKVQCKKLKSFLLCTVYRPPNSPISFLEDLEKAFLDSLLAGMEVIIIGDLNCNLQGNCPDGRALFDFCSTLNLTQLVKEPTRVTERSQTLIDIVLTTNMNIVNSCEVKSSTISDHSLVCVTLKFKAAKPRCSYITARSYKNYTHTKFIDDLASAPFHIANIFDDLDDQVHVFSSLFLDVLNDHAPIKRIKIKSRPNPYITPEIRQLMRTRDKWHKSAIKTKDQLHWNAYRFFRQEVKREIRHAEMEHVRTELQNSNGNSNSIWKVLNRCLPRKDPLFLTTEDPFSQANKFNKFYTSVGISAALKAKTLAEEHGFGSLGHKSTPCPLNSCLRAEQCPLFEFQPVTEEEVGKIIRSLPSNKTPGLDKVTARVLKDSLPMTLSAITNLVNTSFSSSTFAQVWKSAEVIPILKSGDSDEPSNTRPISLLPIMSKVCERSAHSQFVKFLDQHGKISRLQSGLCIQEARIHYYYYPEF